MTNPQTGIETQRAGENIQARTADGKSTRCRHYCYGYRAFLPILKSCVSTIEGQVRLSLRAPEGQSEQPAGGNCALRSSSKSQYPLGLLPGTFPGGILPAFGKLKASCLLRLAELLKHSEQGFQEPILFIGNEILHRPFE